MRNTGPALDAEKIGGASLRDTYRPPPDMPVEPSRSTLLVGTRGAGKTMLLRTLKRLREGSALYGDLGRKILNAVSADTGAGGLTFDEISPHLETPVHNKTLALIAAWLVDQAPKLDGDVRPDKRLLKRVLPASMRSRMPSKDDELADWLVETIPVADLSEFRSQPSDAPLHDFLDDFSENVFDRTGQPLLLLLDRAEEIPYPSLTPVMTLLDQNHRFKSVVACRPGVLGPNPVMNSSVPTPGDHYDIRQLGRTPYSEQWRNFQCDVLRKWLPEDTERIPASNLDVILKISRDSIRFALDIAYKSLDEGGVFCEELMLSAIEDIRGMLQNAASSQLRFLSQDALSILKKVRSAEGYALPVKLKLKSDRARRLFHCGSRLLDLTRDQQFFRLGLRTSLFSMVDGTPWHPYAEIPEIEITPLFLWQKGDNWR